MEPYLTEKKSRRRWWMQLYQLNTQVERMRLYLQVADKKSSRKSSLAKKSQREPRSRIRNRCPLILPFRKRWKNSSVWASRQPHRSTGVSKRRWLTQIWHLISINKASRRNKSSELQVQRWLPTTREWSCRRARQVKVATRPWWTSILCNRRLMTKMTQGSFWRRTTPR